MNDDLALINLYQSTKYSFQFSNKILLTLEFYLEIVVLWRYYDVLWRCMYYYVV